MLLIGEDQFQGMFLIVLPDVEMLHGEVQRAR